MAFIAITSIVHRFDLNSSNSLELLIGEIPAALKPQWDSEGQSKSMTAMCQILLTKFSVQHFLL